MHNIPSHFLAISLLFTSAVTYAQNTFVEPKAPSDWVVQGGSPVLVGDGNMISYKSTDESTVELVSEKSLKIDTSKTYLLSGLFQKSVEAGASVIYFGVTPLNAEGKPITSAQVNVVPQTETELAADCEATDTTLLIKNGGSWQVNGNSKYECVAFNVDPSGNYSDLPNANLSPLGIVSVQQQGNDWEVTLTRACGVNFPAGTKIRKHLAAANAIYVAGKGKELTPNWIELKGKIEGTSTSGNPSDKWWSGTTEAKIVIVVKGTVDTPLEFFFKNILFQEE